MPTINDARIMILATDGFEQSELEVPLKSLRASGATVEIVSLKPGEITGWEDGNWGRPVAVDRELDEVSTQDYDALVLPGGQINPDLLRADADAVDFVKDFARSGKPVAAICHAPWLLIEADLVRNVRATSYKSIRTDMINAGAKWEDREAVTDGNIVTSRQPGDLEAFCAAIVDAIESSSETLSAAE